MRDVGIIDTSFQKPYMTEHNKEIVVLRGKAHGISTNEYGEELRQKLPEYNVQVAKTPEEEVKLSQNAPVITGIDIDEDLVNKAQNLQYFACAAAGTGHLPMDSFMERNIAVTNAAGVHVPNIAEHVLGCLLLFARRLDEGIRRQQRREWRQYKAFGELQGSTVTVVGLGSIGQSIVDRLKPFNVNTIGVRHTPSKDGPTDRVIGYNDTDFHEALSETDYLVLSCPLTDTTRKLISKEEFKTLPSEAVLVNIGRGPIIDTDALLSAVRGNKIRAVALDVTDPEPLPENHPLWNFQNVLITPHVSGHTEDYWARTADIVTANLRVAEESDTFRDLVNQVTPDS